MAPSLGWPETLLRKGTRLHWSCYGHTAALPAGDPGLPPPPAPQLLLERLCWRGGACLKTVCLEEAYWWFSSGNREERQPPPVPGWEQSAVAPTVHEQLGGFARLRPWPRTGPRTPQVPDISVCGTGLLQTCTCGEPCQDVDWDEDCMPVGRCLPFCGLSIECCKLTTASPVGGAQFNSITDVPCGPWIF